MAPRAGQHSIKPASRAFECWKLTRGRFSPVRAELTVEEELTIVINGRHFISVTLTPTMESEFVLGYLFTQGFIGSPEDVLSLKIASRQARVQLKDDAGLTRMTAATGYRIVSGGGRLAYARKLKLPKVISHARTSPQVILGAMNTLLGTAGIYQKTEGTHAAALFTLEGQPICIAEDIGRHNTIDKVVGYGLANRVDFAHSFLVTTGRLSSEMVSKICRAAIPIAATKAAVTNKGRALALRCGVSLVGFVRDTGMRLNTDMGVRVFRRAGMKIYTGSARLLGENATQEVK